MTKPSAIVSAVAPLAFALAVLYLTDDSQAVSKNACRPNHSAQRRHSGHSHVFVLQRPTRDRQNKRHRAGELIGCDSQAGRWFRIASDASLVDSMRMAHGYVAWVEHDEPDENAWPFVLRRMNLRTGIKLPTVRYFNEQPDDDDDWATTRLYVHDYVVGNSGRLAFVGEHNTGFVGRYEVCLAVLSGCRSIDTGSAIKPRSLVRRGQWIYWRNGSTTRFARLP